MAYTTEQYNTLTAAIATGALEVEYGDKKVKYRSQAEMNTLKKEMEKDLNINQRNPSGKVYASFGKGLL